MMKFKKKNFQKRIRESNLPKELKKMLRKLLAAKECGQAPPKANDRLIALVKEHLSDGVCVSDKEFYNVAVHVHEGESFFRFVPKTKRQMKKLEDLLSAYA